MLKTCLMLLSQQTRPADEIIVVDNASTDNTADICSAAGVRRISVNLQGIPATAAAGFDAAAGEIIARLDTDSRPPQDWLERVETILLAAGPMTAVTGPAYFYGGNPLVRWVGPACVPGRLLYVSRTPDRPLASPLFQLRPSAGSLAADQQCGGAGRRQRP